MNQDKTVELVSMALDASLMRQTAIANNIANANTVGYKTLDVNFEPNLKDLSADGTSKPHYILSDHHSSIDEQMVLNVQNMTHYRALIKGLNYKFSIMKLALQGNNQ
ncbi:MAG: flagellar basal body protein [Legionella sp.]|nr:flagellar basal body protein [Legionella sp.]